MASCNGCTMCCTVMKVQSPELVKPEGERCQHCGPRGCEIYDQRPMPCRVFQCLWLASQDRPITGERLPAAFRPDRSQVVLEVNSRGHIIAHCARPNAWQVRPLGPWLKRMATVTRVMIDTGTEVMVIERDGSTSKLERIGVDPISNEVKYVRAKA